MVTVRFKDELKDLLTDTGTRVISDNNLPRLVRQLVVHINVSKDLILCCRTHSHKSADFAGLQEIETSPKAQVLFPVILTYISDVLVTGLRGGE